MIQNLVTSKMLQIAMDNAVKKSHAVGEVIMLANETDPAQAYGGTWERTAKGRFPLGSDVENAGGGQYPLNSTGGEATHTLTVEEMPSHHHPLKYGASFGAGEESDLWIDYSLKKVIGSDGAAVFNVGGGQPFNNMPSYVVFNFWEKISD